MLQHRHDRALTSRVWQRPTEPTGLRSLTWLIPIFLGCAFVIYFMLEITLIPLLEASRWMVLFGTGGFLLLYVLRGLSRIDLTDGLLLSIFGVAPLLMAATLTANRIFSTPFSETHTIAQAESHGNTIELHLTNGAYEEFYRIRNFHSGQLKRQSSITYTFGHGLLGWQVMLGNNWADE